MQYETVKTVTPDNKSSNPYSYISASQNSRNPASTPLANKYDINKDNNNNYAL